MHGQQNIKKKNIVILFLFRSDVHIGSVYQPAPNPVSSGALPQQYSGQDVNLNVHIEEVTRLRLIGTLPLGKRLHGELFS